MDFFVSNWSKNQKKLPQSYIVPQEQRPGNVSSALPIGKIPVIDISSKSERADIIEQIIDASQHFGFFQVVNHGIRREVLCEAMAVFREFFELPSEDKLDLCSEESSGWSCRLYTSTSNYASEEVHYWRDSLKHSSRKESMDCWPRKPARYREVVGEYCSQVRELGSRIIDLISEGLGLEPRYFAIGLSGDALLVVNHYPPCPEPSLALGLPRHCDPNLITILLQGDVPGLQVLVDGEWLLVEACPQAFVVNIGHQFQIISNGKLRSGVHRVVTNANNARTTAGLFIFPSKDCIVEPAKALIIAQNPSLYKSFRYPEFLKAYKNYTDGDIEKALELYRIEN